MIKDGLYEAAAAHSSRPAQRLVPIGLFRRYSGTRITCNYQASNVPIAIISPNCVMLREPTLQSRSTHAHSTATDACIYSSPSQWHNGGIFLPTRIFLQYSTLPAVDDVTKTCTMDHQCPFCQRTFARAMGLNVHVGKMHPDAEDGGMVLQVAKKPRLGPGEWHPPMAPIGNEARGDGIEEEDDDLGDLPELLEAGHMDPEAKREAIRLARKHARDTLVQPQWLEWAKELREEAEETWLTNVEELFTAPPQCPNRETYRYATLMAMHPGAEFHKELLEADREEELLLSEVPPTHHNA